MPVTYSPTEKSLLELLLKDTSKYWDINQLTEMHYKKRDTRPWNPKIVVNRAVNELIKKTAVNREKFTIERIEQAGKKGDMIGVVKSRKRNLTLRG